MYHNVVQLLCYWTLPDFLISHKNAIIVFADVLDTNMFLTMTSLSVIREMLSLHVNKFLITSFSRNWKKLKCFCEEVCSTIPLSLPIELLQAITGNL